MNAFWQYVGIITGTGIVAAIALPALAYGWDTFVSRIRRRRAVAALFVAGLCIYAGAKHGGVKVIEKPVWMSVSSVVDTNTWAKVTFTISANGILPATTPLYIDSALDGQATTTWVERVSTTWAERPGEVSTATFTPTNPTNHLWRIRCDANPEGIIIDDFAALACPTARFVTCTFSCPTNLIGKAGYIECAIPNADVPLYEVVKTVVVSTNNTFRVNGNFISRGINRKFRVRVEGQIFTIGGLE